METNPAVDNETNNTDLGYFCGGKRRGGREGTCRRRAGSGTSHVGVGRCKVHGGSTRSHVIAAERKIARHTADIYGIPRHIDPGTGLIEEYWRTVGIVTALEAKVTSLKEQEIVWGEVEITEGELGTNTDGEPKAGRVVKSRAGLNVWVKLFNEERDRSTGLGERITRLGLEARRDQYIRAQVEVFAGVLLSPDLALTEDQRQTAGRLLRALEAQKVIEGEVAE